MVFLVIKFMSFPHYLKHCNIFSPTEPESWGYPHPSLEVTNTTFLSNEHGSIFRHYNQPSDQFLDLFFRHRWEYITVFGSVFESSRLEAMHVPSITKYDELYMPTFEELWRAKGLESQVDLSAVGGEADQEFGTAGGYEERHRHQVAGMETLQHAAGGVASGGSRLGA